MQTKARILIVEDEAPIYKRMKTVLQREFYEIAPYTPSVAEALEEIAAIRPDLVLLDINLQGKETGLELGELLHKEYHIPFIYVTSFDDDQTFYKGLETFHEDYIVKTKPRLVPKVLIRKIQTVLRRYEMLKEVKSQETVLETAYLDGIQGLIDYLQNLKNYGKNVITKFPINFTDIAFFTTKPFVNQSGSMEKLKSNYLRFHTVDGKYYFFDSSLKDLYKILPEYFARINEGVIINLHNPILKGRINGSKIVIFDKKFTISNTYRKEFEKRYNAIYKTTKK